MTDMLTVGQAGFFLRGREVFMDNLLVRIHLIRWTGLAPWEFEFPFPGSLTPTFLQPQVSSYKEMTDMLTDKKFGFFLTPWK
jgi:hypothetical protein